MRKRASLVCLAGCFLALCQSVRAADVTAKSDPCTAPPHLPAGLSLKLSLKNGQTVFRQGEIITLVTNYTSQIENKYLWNSAENKRAGMVHMEDFCIRPSGQRDPLHDYLDSLLGFGGDTLFNEWPLGPKPQASEMDLNEAYSLPPGNYRLRVVGYRVSDKAVHTNSIFGRRPIPLRSNEVQFKVIAAEPEWQAAQIRDAVDVLKAGNYMNVVQSKDGTVYFDSDKRIRAKRVLRFLGTRASEHEIAVKFADTPNGETSWEYTAGLWASVDRGAVLNDMRAILESHHRGINESFVWTFAEMEMYSDPKWRSLLDDKSNRAATTEYIDELNRRIDAYLAGAGSKRGSHA